MHSSGSEAVDSIGKMHISGNVIPNTWYRTVVKEDGKPYLLAIILLAEFVYWYRPDEHRDEYSGESLGMKKRFAEDKLQKSYPALAEKFGESRRSIMRAVHFLCDIGVITREARTVSKGEDCLLGNVLYIEVVPEVLYKLTYPDEVSESPRGKKTTPCDKNGIRACDKKCISPYTKNCITNTKNTYTQNTISSSSSPSQKRKGKKEEDELKLRLNYERVREKYPEIAIEVWKVISKIPYVEQIVLSEKGFENICRNVSEHAGEIKMPAKYIRTCIDNLLAGQRIAHTQEVRHPTQSRNRFDFKEKSVYDFEELEKALVDN